MKTYVLVIFTVVFVLKASAQHYTHDIGVFIGSTNLQTDYGKRNHFASDWKNNGLSFSIAHYLSFYNNILRWDPHNVMHQHITVKTELQYISNIKIQHYGYWASKDTYEGEQLRAMNGTLRMLSAGINLEYFYHNLDDFVYPHSDISFNPFFTFGFNFTSYTNGLKSDLGDWRQDISVLPEKYTTKDALAIGSGNAISFNIGIGTRYKLTETLDLSAQYIYQYYFSDKLDGLQARVFENKNNEWALNLQFGLIYHLNYSAPLFD